MNLRGTSLQQSGQQKPEQAGTFEHFAELLAQGNLLPPGPALPQCGQSSQGRPHASYFNLSEVLVLASVPRLTIANARAGVGQPPGQMQQEPGLLVDQARLPPRFTSIACDTGLPSRDMMPCLRIDHN